MLPDACYHSVVQEFYVNLHVDNDDDVVSEVRGQRIYLNSSVLNDMLKFMGLSDDELVIPFTK